MSVDVRSFRANDLEGILQLCREENWPSLPEDPARAQRALTAPGVTTVVASSSGGIVGFAQLLSDGEIQAYLCLIAVDEDNRGQGIARAMIQEGLRLAGGLRVDLLTDSAPDFYERLPHHKMQGFRLHPHYSGPDIYRDGVVWENGREK